MQELVNYKQLSFVNDPKAINESLYILIDALQQIPKGKVRVTLEVETDDIGRLKRHYFAMVRELGIEAGYHSAKEKELFKQQIKTILGVVSIEEINNTDDMKHLIESLHQLASEYFNYRRFKAYEEGTLTFNLGSMPK